jgi:hypothetical protein
MRRSDRRSISTRPPRSRSPRRRGALAALLIATGGPVAVAFAGTAVPILEPRSEVILPGWAWGSESPATLAGDRLLIPLGAGGLSIQDISNPDAPSELARVTPESLGGQAGAAVALAGDRLFAVVLDLEVDIAVLDLQAGWPPPPIGWFGEIPQPRALALTGTDLLVQADSTVEHPGGIYAFDTASAIPTAAGAYEVQLVDPGFLARADGTVFLARTPAGLAGAAGVDVVDFSDPEDPDLLGQWSSPLPGNVTGIDVEGDRMFLSAFWGGLWVVDVSDFSAMALVADFDWQQLEPYALDVEWVEPFVLLAQGGPDPALNKLTLLELDAADDLAVVGSIPAGGPILALHRDDRLLIVEEHHDTDGDLYPDEKHLRLFELWLPVFADGFESGDTTHWSTAQPAR